MADNTTHRADVGGIGLVTVILALVFLFVWPGPLRYEYSYRNVGLVRIDRISGRAAVLIDGKHVRVLDVDSGMANIARKEGSVEPIYAPKRGADRP